MTAREASAVVAADALDILVDLDGYSNEVAGTGKQCLFPPHAATKLVVCEQLVHGSLRPPPPFFFPFCAKFLSSSRKLPCLVRCPPLLSGEQGLRRSELFAVRHAPITVAWFVYMSTTGNPFIDYIVGDEVRSSQILQASLQLVYSIVLAHPCRCEVENFLLPPFFCEPLCIFLW